MTDRYNAFDIVEDLETGLCLYTGAPYAVCVNSCTNALGICLEWHNKDREPNYTLQKTIDIPKFTYIGVPMQIKRAGFGVNFREEYWQGEYKLAPYNIWDSARRFTTGMFSIDGIYRYDLHEVKFKCISFHRTKILSHSQGGAILHNNKEFDSWARMMRFDGRTAGVPANQENPTVLGKHCYMDPEIAAALLHNLMYLPDHNEDLPNSDYPDLSKMELFK